MPHPPSPTLWRLLVRLTSVVGALVLAWLGLAQDPSVVWSTNLDQALRTAGEARCLVLAEYRVAGSAFCRRQDEEALTDAKLTPVLKRFVLCRPTTGLLPSPLKRPEGSTDPVFVLFDGDHNVRGLVCGPLDAEPLGKALRAIEGLWHSHDALAFRARSRAGQEDTVRLGRSWAGRLEVDSAYRVLSSLPQGVRVDGADEAWAALGLAFWMTGSPLKAEDAYMNALRTTRSPAVTCDAKGRLGEIWLPDQPDRAHNAWKEASTLLDAPPLLKWRAARLLADHP